MTRSMLAPSDLHDILSAQAPTTQNADLLWLLGAVEEARAAYEQAWAEGDPDAFVSLICLEHVRDDAKAFKSLQVRTAEVTDVRRAGRISVASAQALLEFVAQLIVFRLRDFDDVTRMLVQSAPEGGPMPIPFAGLNSVEVRAGAWRRCLDALLARAETATHPADRAELVLCTAMLGAELGRDDGAWHERLLRVVSSGFDEVQLFLRLRLVDQLGHGAKTSPKHLERWLSPLANRIADPEERFVYRLRLEEARARGGAVPAAVQRLREMAATGRAAGRAITLERAQRLAIEAGLSEVAAGVALERAHHTGDIQLKVALELLAEALHRSSGSGPAVLVARARDLISAHPRDGRSTSGVLAHAYRVLEAVALQAGDDRALAAAWDGRELLPGSGDQSLRRVLFRGSQAALTPAESDVPELLSRLHAGVPRATVRAALSLAFIAKGWTALGTAFDPGRVPADLRLAARRVQALSLLLHAEEPKAALELLEGVVAEGAHDAPTLAALWLAAESAGDLARFRERFAEWGRELPEVAVRLRFRALAAAAEAELGDPSRSSRMAQELAARDSGDMLVRRLVARIEARQRDQAPLDLGPRPILDTLGGAPELSALVDRAEQHLARGDAPEAAALLSDAAGQAAKADPGLAAALYTRAGAVLGGSLGPAEDGEANSAEEYLTRALELQPENASAWRSLCTLLARRGRYNQVASLVERLPQGVDPSRLPAEDLRRSARALKALDPPRAVAIFELLVRTAASRPVTDAVAADLDELYELARRTEAIPAYRDLLESLVVGEPADTFRGELNFRLGVLFADALRDVDLAVEHLRRALEDTGTRARSGQQLTALLEEQERWEELVEVLLTAAEAERDVERVTAHLGRAADLLRDRLLRPDDAAEALEVLLGHNPRHLASLLKLADHQHAQEAWERVVELLERAARLVEDKRERSQVYQRLGEVYQMHLEKPNLALESYLVSFMCDSANRETFDRLERLYTATERHKELVGILNIAIETTLEHGDSSPFNLEELYARRAHIEFKYLKDPRQAAESLLAALRINPSNHRYLRLIEGHLLDHADPDTILQAYEEVASSMAPNSPELPDLIRAQAAVAERLPDRREQAIGYYSRLLELDPADKSAFARLETWYRKAQTWDALIELYRRQLAWVKKPEQTVSLYHKIARIYETQRRDLPAAAATYADLLKLVPASISALRGLGRLYEAMRRWDDLVDVSEREVRLVDDDRVKAHLLFKIGSIYETHRGDVDKAVEYYRRAVDHDARCVPALHGLRDIFQRRGQPGNVIEYLEREASIWDNPRERSSIHSRIAEVYWEDLGDADQAVTHLRRALDLVPDSTPALHRLLDVFVAGENWAEAAPIVYSLTKNPDSLPSERRGQLFLRRGLIASHLGNRREAVESLKIALDITPDDPEAFERLAQILAEEGDADAHAEFFTRLQKEFADRQDAAGLARVKRFLGRQAENRRDLREATAAYDEAIELDPEAIAGLRDVVRVTVRQRRFEEAHERALAFARGASSPEARLTALVISARVLLDHLDRRKEAREALRQALGAEPTKRDALFLAAQAAYLDADWRHARQYMERLVQLDTQSQNGPTVDRAERAEHAFYLGRILEVGFEDFEQALSCYARAREENPVDPRPLKAALLVLFRQKNWHRLDGLLDRALQGAAASGGKEATVPLLLFSAKLSLLRDDEEKAHQYLRRLLEIEPGHHDARAMLVELVRDTTLEESEGALVELGELLASNVFDAEALQGMAELRMRQGEDDQAACLRSVLDLLGDERGRDSGAVLDLIEGRRFEDDDIGEHVHPAILRSGYLRALARLGPALARLGLERPSRLPSRSRRLRDEDLGPLRSLRDAVWAARRPSAGHIDLYDEGPSGTAISALVDDGEPKVVLELQADLVSELDRREARFVLGHAVELLASGTWTILATPRADLTSLLWWLSRWAEAASSPPPTEEAPWVERLDDALIRDLRALLTDASAPLEPLHDPQHAQRFAIALEEATATNGDRMGLVLCGDLRAAVSAVLKIETGAGLEMVRDAAAELGRSRRVTNLVRYAVSEPYFAIRRLLAPEQ